MPRACRAWSPVLLAVLACAQLAAAVGLPVFENPTARRTTPCGNPTCDCGNACRCSIAKPCVPEPEAEPCCATGCCAKKAKPVFVRVVGLFARGCGGSPTPAGLPATEPSLPPVSDAIAFAEPASDAAPVSDAESVSRPAIPPVPRRKCAADLVALVAVDNSSPRPATYCPLPP